MENEVKKYLDGAQAEMCRTHPKHCCDNHYNRCPFLTEIAENRMYTYVCAVELISEYIARKGQDESV